MKTVEYFYTNIVNFHQTKLYETSLDSSNCELSILHPNNIYLSKIFEPYNNSDSDYAYNNPYNQITHIDDYKKILEKVSRYKLKKNKKGENAPTNKFEEEIFTIKMQRLTKFIRQSVALTIYYITKTGYLYFSQNDNFNKGDVFFIPKNKLQVMSPKNSRCLLNCDNRLKVLTRYLRDEYLKPIFEANLVDTEIHRVKKCVVKYMVGNKTKFKLCFESIANIANIIHTTPHKYLLLDLTNAYNNVTYTFMYRILKEYLVVSDKTEKENVCNGIVRLLSEIKYQCRQTKENVKRNKGVPQGSSISVDLFVLCMDYIIKHIIRELKTTLELEYKTDYELVVYVDDILILIKSNKFENNINKIIDVFANVFHQYHFQLNSKKSKKSVGLPNCEFDEITPIDKYLGLYLETNPDKYLAIVETEISKKWKHNPRFQNIKAIEQNLKESKFTIKQTMSIRGKLQYRMRPFAKNIEERNKLFHKLGYPNIADTLFKIKNIE